MIETALGAFLNKVLIKKRQKFSQNMTFDARPKNVIYPSLHLVIVEWNESAFLQEFYKRAIKSYILKRGRRRVFRLIIITQHFS